MAARDNYRMKMDAHEMKGGVSVAMKGLRDVDGYLTKREPWYKNGVEFVA